MHKHVRPGVTTRELDAVGASVLRSHGARPAPMFIYGFPGSVCISVNDEIVHGVPGDRVIRRGDIVKLDVAAEKSGYIADAAITVPVSPVSEEAMRLVACVRAAFYKAMETARAGLPVNLIGRAIESEVIDRGFSIIPQFTGHGIGLSMHQAPCIPNFFDPEMSDELTEGQVLAIEPIVAARSAGCVKLDDGWTYVTSDGGLAAHFEHTIVVTRGRPILLTQ